MHENVLANNAQQSGGKLSSEQLSPIPAVVVSVCVCATWRQILEPIFSELYNTGKGRFRTGHGLDYVIDSCFVWSTKSKCVCVCPSWKGVGTGDDEFRIVSSRLRRMITAPSLLPWSLGVFFFNFHWIHPSVMSFPDGNWEQNLIHTVFRFFRNHKHTEKIVFFSSVIINNCEWSLLLMWSIKKGGGEACFRHIWPPFPMNGKVRGITLYARILTLLNERANTEGLVLRREQE